MHNRQDCQMTSGSTHCPDKGWHWSWCPATQDVLERLLAHNASGYTNGNVSGIHFSSCPISRRHLLNLLYNTIIRSMFVLILVFSLSAAPPPASEFMNSGPSLGLSSPWETEAQSDAVRSLIAFEIKQTRIEIRNLEYEPKDFKFADFFTLKNLYPNICRIYIGDISLSFNVCLLWN